MGSEEFREGCEVGPCRAEPGRTTNLTNFFTFSKLLVIVLGPVSVDELVSVEDAPSAPLRSAPGFR